MTITDTSSLVSLSDADIMRMGVAALLRIAAAMEAQREPEPETLEYPLSQLKGFDWASIGATIVATDEDGVSTIRTAEGKFAKRRSNDKFGVEVWFSYATGKKPDGTNLYRKVIEFKDSKPAEPLGRKTAQALAQAAPAVVEPQKPATPAESPLMAPIRARWSALLAEYVSITPDPVPVRFVLSSTAAVPENQHRTDEFAQFVAGLKMAKADHAPAKIAAAGSWAAKVAALKPLTEKRAEIRDIYEWLFAIAKKANEGVPPYDTMPASLADAIARCADMAKIADATQKEAA